MICEEMFRLNKDGEPSYRCYCRNPELIENYDKAIADKTQTWQVHHRKEEFYSCAELIEMGEYFDVPPEELIFLTKSEHSKIDSKCRRHSRTMKGKFINRKDLSKKVLCVETGKIFESIMEAERKTGINNGNIGKACRGIFKSAGGFHWQFVD